jgi:hypothetical protein
MPVVATSRYSDAGDVLGLVRALLNDPNAVIWNDAALFPFLNAAYRSLQEELAINGVTVMTTYADLDLPLVTLDGTTTAPNPARIADDTDPQLPTDLVVPYRLEERATGTDDVFVPMEKITGAMPNFDPMAYLRIWKWEADQILLIGATQAVTVRIEYERALPGLSQESDPIEIPYANRSLAYEVAALAARSRGARDLALDMEQAADRTRQRIVERYTRAEQYKARRKKPYGYRRRVIYL